MSSNTQRAPAQPFNDVADYRHIPLVEVESSQIRAVGYDAARRTLAVQFRHGLMAVYQYAECSPDLHAEFMASDSKGTFFGKRVSPLAFSKFPASVLDGRQDHPEDTPVTIAALLHGNEYASRDNHITEEAVARALAAGILIVCGASDDLVEFYGAWRDEAGAYEGTEVLVDAQGIIPDWESMDDCTEEEAAAYLARKPGAAKIECLWSPEDDAGKTWASWAYKTDIPHATFDILEDGDIYCRGIVLALADLAKPAA